MKILFLSVWFPYPADNGSKLRVYHLLRALAARHEVTLLSFAFDTAAPQRAAGLRECCADIRTIGCDPFERNRSGSLRRFFAREPVAARAIPEMSELTRATLSEQGFDVVIASTALMAAYAQQAPETVKRVLEEHNSLTRMMWDRYLAQGSALQRLRCWVSWQKTRRYEARLFRRFDLITMVSDQDRATSLSGLPGFRGAVEVVPNGVDCAHNQPGLATPQPRSLVYNGALTYSANYDAMDYFLNEIYSLIRAQEPAVSLAITGSTSGVDLAGLPLGTSAQAVGFVEDVRPPVAGAWAMVAPIRQGGGTRLKILEAMALGTPVVATSKAAEGLAVTPGRDILIADGPDEFAGRVLQLLRDAALREYLAGNARQLVELRYDWQAIGHRFVDLVEEVGG
jgi:glycosyltransferase involved in cell wall biosynthesis